MARNRNRKMPNKIKKGTFPRLLKFICKDYGVHLGVVAICVILSAVSSVFATVFLQKLIDDCITPGLTVGMGAVQGTLIKLIAIMAGIYFIGFLASFIYTRIMAIVTQGTLKNLSVKMFDKMQTLPIKYFDTHPHGDIMSTYTNDTDAIRQLIGQCLPMLFQIGLTIISLALMMLYYSFYLSIVVFIFAILMYKVILKFGGLSSK